VKDYECGHCKGFHNDEEELKYLKLGNDMIEVVQDICYLGDVVGSSGDVQSSVMARIRAVWRNKTWYLIIHISHNNILKIVPWPPGHYDVIDEIKNGGFMDILVVLFHE